MRKQVIVGLDTGSPKQTCRVRSQQSDGRLDEREKLVKRSPELKTEQPKCSMPVVRKALIFSFTSSYLIKDLPNGKIIYSPTEQSMMQQPRPCVQQLDKEDEKPVRAVAGRRHQASGLHLTWASGCACKEQPQTPKNNLHLVIGMEGQEKKIEITGQWTVATVIARSMDDSGNSLRQLGKMIVKSWGWGGGGALKIDKDLKSISSEWLMVPVSMNVGEPEKVPEDMTTPLWTQFKCLFLN